MAKKKKERRKLISCKLKRGKPKTTSKGTVTPFTARFEILAPETIEELKITGPKWTATNYGRDREWDVIDF